MLRGHNVQRQHRYVTESECDIEENVEFSQIQTSSLELAAIKPEKQRRRQDWSEDKDRDGLNPQQRLQFHDQLGLRSNGSLTVAIAAQQPAY